WPPTAAVIETTDAEQSRNGEPVHGERRRVLGSGNQHERDAATDRDHERDEVKQTPQAWPRQTVRKEVRLGRGAEAPQTSQTPTPARMGPAWCSRSCWRSGAMLTTFRARPTFSSMVMTSAEGSSIRSHRRSPCAAERGNAWWLWCHASPNESSASHATLVEWSSVWKRRVPRKWQTEFTLHVTWCTRKMRTSPPQSRPPAAPARVPVRAQPANAGTARVSSTSTGKRRLMSRMPGSS